MPELPLGPGDGEDHPELCYKPPTAILLGIELSASSAQAFESKSYDCQWLKGRTLPWSSCGFLPFAQPLKATCNVSLRDKQIRHTRSQIPLDCHAFAKQNAPPLFPCTTFLKLPNSDVSTRIRCHETSNARLEDHWQLPQVLRSQLVPCFGISGADPHRG